MLFSTSSGPDSSIPDDQIGATLDNEIAALQAQINAAKAKRALQASAILSSHTTQRTIQNLRAAQQSLTKGKSSKAIESSTIAEDVAPLLSTSTSQSNHHTTNLYRACGSITSFTIQDPDPNAVNGGHVLALRFDVTVNGKFGKSYYIMLNKPFGEQGMDGAEERKDLLRVHRHTFPPYIPIADLARRYLPNGKGVSSGYGKGEPGAKRQDLQKFARALRREIVGYHKRESTIKNLRKEFNLDEKRRTSRKGKEREVVDSVIADISAADAEAKQVRIEWHDGRIGRVLVDEEGKVKKCVIIGENGRDLENESVVMGKEGACDMEGIGERLRERIY